MNRIKVYSENGITQHSDFESVAGEFTFWGLSYKWMGHPFPLLNWGSLGEVLRIQGVSGAEGRGQTRHLKEGKPRDPAV